MLSMVSTKVRMCRCRNHKQGMGTATDAEVEYMFYSGELHGKALGRRFKKTSADLQWRFLFSCFVLSAVP
jgi:hypothetical protein